MTTAPQPALEAAIQAWVNHPMDAGIGAKMKAAIAAYEAARQKVPERMTATKVLEWNDKFFGSTPPEAAPQTGGLVEEGRLLAEKLAASKMIHTAESFTVTTLCDAIERLERERDDLSSEFIRKCEDLLTAEKGWSAALAQLATIRAETVAEIAAWLEEKWNMKRIANDLRALTPGQKGGTSNG